MFEERFPLLQYNPDDEDDYQNFTDDPSVQFSLSVETDIINIPAYRRLYSEIINPVGILGEFLDIASSFENSIVNRIANDSLENFNSFERSESREPLLPPEDFSEEKHKNKKCSICLEIYKIDDKIIHPDCGHIFHYDCLCTWVSYKPECPLCRSNISVSYKDIN